MKSIIIAVGCSIVGFLGMQAYTYLGDGSPSTSSEVEPEVKAPPKKEPVEKPRPQPARTAKAPQPVAKPAPRSTGPTQWVSTPSTSSSGQGGSSRSKSSSGGAGMYFTVVRDKKGVPDRVVVHNTEVGTLTILLIGVGDGRFFKGQGTTAKKYKWEVQINNNVVSVQFDGKSVRPG